MTQAAKTDPDAIELKLLFGDGTAGWVKEESGFDFVFNHIFIKYALICLTIVFLLQHRADALETKAWEFGLVWVNITITVLLWFAFVSKVVIFLKKRGISRAIYTPLVSVPCVFATEMTMQVTMHYITGDAFEISRQTVQYLVQSMCAVMLFDILFGNFVAHAHPMIETEDVRSQRISAQADTVTPAEQPEPTPLSQVPSAQPLMAAPKSKAPAAPIVESPALKAEPFSHQIVDFNGERFVSSSIVSLQIEDHYLRVDTGERNTLIRYKLSTAASQMNPELGLQINRSVWVARSAIKDVRRTQSYGLQMTLENEKSYQVSRSRVATVLELCGRWGIPVARAS